jgi:hypothetical protein
LSIVEWENSSLWVVVSLRPSIENTRIHTETPEVYLEKVVSSLKQAISFMESCSIGEGLFINDSLGKVLLNRAIRGFKVQTFHRKNQVTLKFHETLKRTL